MTIFQIKAICLISAISIVLLILLAIDALNKSHPIYHLIYG